MKRRANPKKWNGFTLIELLIVISIIAILAGMLLPMLNNARKSARNVECISRLNQIGQATVSYVGDNRDWYYSAFNGGVVADPIYSNQTTIDVWVQTLNPYFGYNDRQIRNRPNEPFACPILPFTSNWYGTPSSSTPRLRISYGYNTVFFGQFCNSGQKSSSIKNASLLLTHADSCHNNESGSDFKVPNSQLVRSRVAFRHNNKKANALYADGHVQKNDPGNTFIDMSTGCWVGVAKITRASYNYLYLWTFYQ